MASPALASRRSRARVSTPSVASNDIAEGVVCVSCARRCIWSIATVRFLAIKKNPNVEVASRQICAHVRLRHVPGSYRPLDFGVRGRDGHGD